MKVIVVETGEYEDRCVVLVASSREIATAEIKKIYAAPYVVRWEEDMGYGLIDGLFGHFEAVPEYSTNHVAYFDFTEYEVAQ